MFNNYIYYYSESTFFLLLWLTGRRRRGKGKTDIYLFWFILDYSMFPKIFQWLDISHCESLCRVWNICLITYIYACMIWFLKMNSWFEWWTIWESVGTLFSPHYFSSKLNRLINTCSFIYSQKYKKYKTACQIDNLRKLTFAIRCSRWRTTIWSQRWFLF